MKDVRLSFDISAPEGRIRPLHGVNNGPVSLWDGSAFRCDATELFRRAGIYRVRTHDTEYPFGSEQFVDVPCIFPNFDADENDPANYFFGPTDAFLRAVSASGAKLLYRLGVSIEHQRVKRFVYPPRDFEKWGRICRNIVAHVSHGWAGGGCERDVLWEIWNEPDLGAQMWTGSAGDYARLYNTAARAIKAAFPEEKVGGCALSHPNKDAFAQTFLSSLEPGTPLDFFSWHCYAKTPDRISAAAAHIRSLLAGYGRGDTPSLLDEYNYVADWSDLPSAYEFISSGGGGAFTAAVLCEMQRSGVAEGSYYSAQMWNGGENLWNGLYTVSDGRAVPLPAFRAMEAFDRLYRLGSSIPVELPRDSGVYAAAASDGAGEAALLASNFGGEPVRLLLPGGRAETLGAMSFFCIKI